MIKAVIFDCFGVVLHAITNEPQPLVISYIQSLKGQYTLGMVSNVISRNTIDRHFREGELDQLFDTVIASGEAGVEKPDPKIYHMAAEQLGVRPEECLFVDDIGQFCAAAEAVGMKSVTFLDPRISIDDIKQQLGAVHADNH